MINWRTNKELPKYATDIQVIYSFDEESKDTFSCLYIDKKFVSESGNLDPKNIIAWCYCKDLIEDADTLNFCPYCGKKLVILPEGEQ